MQLSCAEVAKVKTRVVPKLLRKRQRTKKHRGSYTRTHTHKTPTLDNPTTQHSLSSQNTTIHSTLRNHKHQFQYSLHQIHMQNQTLPSFHFHHLIHIYFYSFFIFQHLQPCALHCHILTLPSHSLFHVINSTPLIHHSLMVLTLHHQPCPPSPLSLGIINLYTNFILQCHLSIVSHNSNIKLKCTLSGLK